MIAIELRQRMLERYEFIQAKMSSDISSDEMMAMGKEYAELKPVIDILNRYQTVLDGLNDAESMLDDPEMKELAKSEIAMLNEELPGLEHEVKIALLPKDATDNRSAILEIRAGTGGDEAGIFAGDLFRMYTRFAENEGWKINLIEGSETGVGGYKEIIANVTGEGVFAKLKFESGVHRVQRVPVTESGGRVHTSAATVAVLPEAEEVEIEIDQNDIRIDTMRASGSGGQHVNTTDSAVRITHIPTGIIAMSSEKSQHQNREIAMRVLKTRLYDKMRQEADDARASDRKSQVGSGDRSERIRTYNYPQGRVTDHRINLTLYKLDQVMDGEISDFVDALITADQAERLAELGL